MTRNRARKTRDETTAASTIAAVPTKTSCSSAVSPCPAQASQREMITMNTRYPPMISSEADWNITEREG